jgi:hypothetical protein
LFFFSFCGFVFLPSCEISPQKKKKTPTEYTKKIV